ncbi:hypothetical protein [Fluviispira vulneris]|uniref:hypothetical protein n=1 Tax=Fluviispira vulneris TaxID=2763012 RepID=UPI00164608E0|nr:hypothetical protein [Fluviispira vulneris]
MIIDDDGMIPAAYTRYRGRVLKNYFEDETTGQLKESTISIKIPRAAKEILLDTFQNPAYEKMPSELLRPSSKIFREKFSDMIYSLNLIGHSTLIFNYIANNSPNSQFVLIHSGMNKFNQIFCSNDLSEKEKINNISALFKSQSDDIIEIINKYKINFISYSRGYHYDSLRKIADKNDCKNTSNALIKATNEVYFKSFLQPLTTQTEAILVQSNKASNNKIKSLTDENYFSDCQKLDNRVRVGPVNDFSLSIPFQGSDNLKLLDYSEKNVRICTDIYINFAVKNYFPYTQYRNSVVQTSQINLGTTPIMFEGSSSSNATPVAVTYLMYLKMQWQKQNPYRIITNKMLLNELYLKRNFIFDPSLYKQLPIYGLGHLQ